MIKKFQQFRHWMSRLKKSNKALTALITINFFMAIASNIVDWPWLMSVDWYLLPVTPICSLFPLTLGIWFLLYKNKKRVPPWFTTFIFIGIISYGVMAYIYYPLYISQISGFSWRLLGNMLWVTIYALQSLIIVSELKPVKLYQFSLIITYYLFKDYSDRYLGSFIDILQPTFPETFKDLFGLSILSLHIMAFAFTAKLTRKNVRTAQISTEQSLQSA